MSLYKAQREKMKRHETLKHLLFAVGSAVAIGSAVIAATYMPAPSNAQSAKKQYLNIQEVKSASGLTAWLVEDHSMPIISMAFTFAGAGSINDSAAQQGLTILASNTMDEGAGPYSAEDFQKTLTDNNITLNFTSGRDDFGGSLATLTKNKALAFELLKLALTNAKFEEDAITRMRDANIARIRNAQSNPDWIAARIMNDRVFEGHPYALNSGGTISTLNNITRNDLLNFAKTRIGRDRLYIVVTGDITADELRRTMDDVFGGLPTTSKVRASKIHNLTASDKKDASKDDPRFGKIALKNAGKSYHYDLDIPQTIISITQDGISRQDPDYYAASVMNFILGGSGFGSRLMEEVREKRGLTYGINSGFSSMNEAETFGISTSTNNETAAEVIDIIRAELKRMADEPVSNSELDDAKSFITGSLPLNLTNTSSITSLVMGLRLDQLPIDYLDHRNEKIMAVTKEDIQRVAKRLLKEDAMTIITVGKPKGLEPQNIIETLPNAQ
jgi:zinc protease